MSLRKLIDSSKRNRGRRRRQRLLDEATERFEGLARIADPEKILRQTFKVAFDDADDDVSVFAIAARHMHLRTESAVREFTAAVTGGEDLPEFWDSVTRASEPNVCAAFALLRMCMEREEQQRSPLPARLSEPKKEYQQADQ